MLTYWRKNEKDELALRKKSEKEALEKAKAEEESREAKRQSRKLNFLLTQTELYSHFIGKKIKTAEAERPDDEDIAPANGADGDKMDKEGKEKEANGDLGLDDQGEALPDIDYDAG
jgi:DNA helicase INO80